MDNNNNLLSANPAPEPTPIDPQSNPAPEPTPEPTPTPIEPQSNGEPEPINNGSNTTPDVLITAAANAEPPVNNNNAPDDAPKEIEINEETIAAYQQDIGFENIPEFELGTNFHGEIVKMSKTDMATLVPAMMKLGIPKEKAGETISLIAAYQQVQLDKETTLAREAVNKRIEESRNKFGEDLQRVCKDAEKGALAIFDKTLWGEMCATPILINDARFIDALAKVGRMIKTDTGTKATPSGVPSEGKWSADHWIQSSAKVNNNK